MNRRQKDAFSSMAFFFLATWILIVADDWIYAVMFALLAACAVIFGIMAMGNDD